MQDYIKLNPNGIGKAYHDKEGVVLMERIFYSINKNHLHQQHKEIMVKNFIWFYHVRSFFESMKNIPYAVIKGEVLSLEAYDGLGYRNNTDIDILIPRGEIKQVEMLLAANGFIRDIYDASGRSRELTKQEKIMFRNSHQTVPYVKWIAGKSVVPLDINIDIYWSEYSGQRVDLYNFLSDTKEITLYGSVIKVLPTLKHFIVLCLHHYKEMNAIYHLAMGNPFTEKMYEDIYMMYKKLNQDEIKRLLDMICDYKWENIFLYLFFYTSIVFQDQKMYMQAHTLATMEGLDKLNCYGLTASERKFWPISFIERMNHPNIFSIIEPELTQDDKDKMKLALSIF